METCKQGNGLRAAESRISTRAGWEAAEEGQSHPEVRKSSLGRSTWLLRNDSWCVQFSEEHRLWHQRELDVNPSSAVY